MEPSGIRAGLIANLDAIVSSQERIRDVFLGWANLNRQTNADAAAPTPPQKMEYLHAKAAVMKLFDELTPAANAAVGELDKKISQTEKDIADLQKTIASKSLD